MLITNLPSDMIREIGSFLSDTDISKIRFGSLKKEFHPIVSHLPLRANLVDEEKAKSRISPAKALLSLCKRFETSIHSFSMDDCALRSLLYDTKDTEMKTLCDFLKNSSILLRKVSIGIYSPRNLDLQDLRIKELWNILVSSHCETLQLHAENFLESTNTDLTIVENSLENAKNVTSLSLEVLFSEKIQQNLEDLKNLKKLEISCMERMVTAHGEEFCRSAFLKESLPRTIASFHTLNDLKIRDEIPLDKFKIIAEGCPHLQSLSLKLLNPSNEDLLYFEKSPTYQAFPELQALIISSGGRYATYTHATVLQVMKSRLDLKFIKVGVWRAQDIEELRKLVAEQPH